ncbi:MAG: 4Fe-4S cluster-binding domain-containing protein [Bacillota bacterium]|uniref:4Fe-4S cluster-binding domain-containing protein n=1 Tax=Thermanaerosceptrum fracticalcis TaxID=1712410 RepID=A0A7G6E3R7_THEFR|nr:4Fe-4S cluster-binding domain-containing protein [Thermanaerosceptrum fracticalcis]QNB46721.1 4Fe-4S cluster-binding domain-containing protein [Thermanaerosceptrum fracticalcis]
MTDTPGYRSLLAKGELRERVKEARKHLTECNLCPHECAVNRKERIGFCRARDRVVVASYGPHFGEEGPLVGKNGSGTIFFGYCNMRCVFCQNCELSFGGEGEEVSNEALAKLMLKLQNYYRCHNINLVTPTHFVPNILEALSIAAEEGLNLPLVYNCGGYERLKTLQLLEGIVDIYMPDFKYNTAERGEKYSRVKDYPVKVKAALKEMDRQVGGLKLDDRGIAYQGLLIRHLMMPGGLEDTKKVLEFIKEELSPECLVNLMEQYYPEHQAFQYEEIARPLTREEFREAYLYAHKLGLRLAR